MLRYFQYIHISIKSDASIDQMTVNLKFQSSNRSYITKHYQCKFSVDDAIECLATAVNKISAGHISAAEFFTVNEDAQTVNSVGARG